jgi:hypothetical protein
MFELTSMAEAVSMAAPSITMAVSGIAEASMAPASTPLWAALLSGRTLLSTLALPSLRFDPFVSSPQPTRANGAAKNISANVYVVRFINELLLVGKTCVKIARKCDFVSKVYSIQPEGPSILAYWIFFSSPSP